MVDYISKPEEFKVRGREKMLKFLYPEGMIEVRIKKNYPDLKVVS